MLPTSARLLRLLTLLQTQATWTGGDLTARLEITARTLRRDVDRLRALGYPVDSTTGPAGGYKLGAGAALPPLMLTNDEGLAVAIALQGGTADVAGLEEPAQRALAKIEQVLPRRLRTRLESWRAAIVRTPAARKQRVARGVFESLASACSEHRLLTLGYRDGQGRVSERLLEPQRLVLSERHWYLVAWDRGRRDWRTFRVDRIAPPVSLGETFTPRLAPEGDAAGLVARATSWEIAPLQAKVVFHADVSTLAAKIPAAYGRLTAIDTDRCRLETGGTSLEGIAMWLGWTGVPFEVESPAALAEHLCALGKRLVSAGTTTSRTWKPRK